MPASSAPSLIAGRYELGELLGSGGMSLVHAGTDRKLRRPIAIKLLRPEMAAREDVRNRFEAEARLAAVIAHPNAVAVYDTGEHAGTPYIVMERLPGHTLADVIAQGPMEPERARRMARQILGALESAHLAGLVHRDVKPSNVLIAADGQVKLADFGIAKSLAGPRGADLTLTGQVVGTPAYLSPEQREGRTATPRSDVYAVGVVLYEALTGSKPSLPPQPLASVRPDVDADLAAAVDRALSLDPAGRFASAGEMSVALGRAEASGPVPGPPVDATRVLAKTPPVAPVAAPPLGGPVGPPPRPAGRRSRRPALILGLVLLVVVAALALVTVRRGDSPPAEIATGGYSDPLAQELAAAAAGLTPENDGPRAPEVAKRLRGVADAVDEGAGGPEASDLLAKIESWDRSGELSDVTSEGIRRLLLRVPGVVAPTSRPMTSILPPPEPTTVPATQPPDTAPPATTPPATEPVPTTPSGDGGGGDGDGGGGGTDGDGDGGSKDKDGKKGK